MTPWDAILALLIPLFIAVLLILFFNRPKLDDRAVSRRIARLDEGKHADIPIRFTSDPEAAHGWALILLRVHPSRGRAWSYDPRHGRYMTGILEGVERPARFWPGWVILPSTEEFSKAEWIGIRVDELDAARRALGIDSDHEEDSPGRYGG